MSVAIMDEGGDGMAAKAHHPPRATRRRQPTWLKNIRKRQDLIELRRQQRDKLLGF